MNGSFNQSAKTTGVGFGLAVVPVAGGSITPLTKIDILTSLNEEYNEVIYAQLTPNPSHNKLNVSLKGIKNENVYFEVLSLEGKKIFEISDPNNISNTLYSLSIESLNPGIYFLKIIQGDNEKSIRFIKE